MVINGASRRSVGFWTKHLANDEKNDRAELKEIRGLAAENLKDALLEMQGDAHHTRCKNFFYQANFNPALGEHLTEEQWQRAFEIFEGHRGIPEGQPRIVYEHEKEGRVHRHVIWSRIDLENMRAWPDGLDAKVCHAASRAISLELGLELTPSPLDKDREGPRPDRAPKAYEMFRGLRSGVDPREVKIEVTAIYRESENAADFINGLRQNGYELVQGDRRDFCVLDGAGEIHSLARRLEGVNAKQLRSFMMSIDRDTLPTADQAKAHYAERLLEGHLADLATIQQEIMWEEQLARAGIAKEKGDDRRRSQSEFRHATERVVSRHHVEEKPKRDKRIVFEHTPEPSVTDAVKSILGVGEKAFSTSLGMAFGATTTIADAFSSLFDPPLTAEQKLEAEIASHERQMQSDRQDESLLVGTDHAKQLEQEQDNRRRYLERDR